MQYADFFQRIHTSLDKHHHWRSQTLNLSAAENLHSPDVHRLLATDLTQRYGDYRGRDPSARKYQGTRYIQELEAIATELAQEVFHTRYVELRGISGHITDVAVMLGLARAGSVILELGADPGGHGDGRKLCENPLVDARIAYLPFDSYEYNLDLPKTIQMMRELRPTLVKLGSSALLFPQPVADICDEAQRLGDMYVAYDASHVLGLIAGGMFQQPLAEGADVMMGSTHKTLPGPQGGIILSNDLTVIEKVSAAVYPTLVSNHHLTRMPALAMALLETLAFGNEYARQIVANAKRLGEEIQRRGISVVAAHKGFSESHIVLLQTSDLGDHQELANNLEDSGIIVNASRLPAELGGQGIRIGVQEITRMGAKADDMPFVAELITQSLKEEASPEKIAQQVTEFREGFQTIQYWFGADGPEHG